MPPDPSLASTEMLLAIRTSWPWNERSIGLSQDGRADAFGARIGSYVLASEGLYQKAQKHHSSSPQMITNELSSPYSYSVLLFAGE